MVRRIRPRLSPATVITAIALFAALGGGYATAFSGSGTVQKGALLGLPDTTFPPAVRTLTGIGSIDAACSSGVPQVYFKNSSGESLYVQGIGLDDDIEGVGVAHGDRISLGAVNGRNTMYLHITPTDGTKRPQADVQITATDLDNCFASRVSVLATNTEE